MTYQEIIATLAKKYKISERDCERIVDSQFRVVVSTIQSKGKKTINLIKLGKFTPVKKRLKLNFIQDEVKTDKGDNPRDLEQSI